MTDHTERWLPVIGYEGLYEVSDLGRVRSLDRLVGGPYGPASRIFPGRVLALQINRGSKGYPFVFLYREGRGQHCAVHILVLTAFDRPCPPGTEALHGPGGKSDASIANLRWGTRSENVGADRLRDGQSNRGEKSGQAKLTWDKVCEIRESRRTGESSQSISNRFGVSIRNVYMIVNRETWRYPPEEW